jgi:hypothetical protein
MEASPTKKPRTNYPPCSPENRKKTARKTYDAWKDRLTAEKKR